MEQLMDRNGVVAFRAREAPPGRELDPARARARLDRAALGARPRRETTR